MVKHFSLRTLCALVWAALLVCPVVPADLTDLAINHPDEFSWVLFTQVTSPLPTTSSSKGVVFESWANNDDTFAVSPTFPSFPKGPTALRTPALASANVLPGHPRVMPGGGEEVRRNREAFDFIIKNNLHTRGGLVSAFKAKSKIDFPIAAIEIKAEWLPEFYVSDASQYYSNTAGGKKFVLVALHVISKQLPNWTWATFEHQNTPGRCDFTGCSDAFGATDAKTLPRNTGDTNLGQSYGACSKSQALADMFTQKNLDIVWRNYCLKGSQVDFIDSTGEPTLLGNSVTEAPLIQTSSCIACHARAATNDKGANVFGFGSINSPCPKKGVCSPRGPPDPAWFWSHPVGKDRQLIALQMDFVWSIPRCAVPASKGDCR